MLKKLFYLLFLLCVSLDSHTLANSTYVYLDMNFVLNNSKVGKNLINKLNKENDIIQKKFNDTEAKLNATEKDILLKKNILTNEEFNKKISILKKEFLQYKNNKIKTLNNQSQKRIKYQEKIINLINPILIEYMENESISVIFKKESIIVAPKDLNITSEIIKKLDKKIEKINLN